MNLTKSTLPIALATVCLLTSPARGQGSNNCADAQLVSGSGPHTFRTSDGATTDGHEEGVLHRPGLRQIANDVWFRWVAPSTAVYRVNTDHVPQTNGATAVAIYKYGCPTGPGRAIAGRMGAEAGGGLWAYPSFGAEEGTEYLFRIGKHRPRQSYERDLHHRGDEFSCDPDDGCQPGQRADIPYARAVLLERGAGRGSAAGR